MTTYRGRAKRAATAGASVLVLALILTGCSGSGSAGPPTSQTTNAASTRAIALAAPLQFAAMTAKQDSVIEKVVPLLPGVQNTAYSKADMMLLVYMSKGATPAQIRLVRSQIDKLRKSAGKHER